MPSIGNEVFGKKKITNFNSTVIAAGAIICPRSTDNVAPPQGQQFGFCIQRIETTARALMLLLMQFDYSLTFHA